MQEILLTAEQVAQYLKVDKITVYRLVAQKTPIFTTGGSGIGLISALVFEDPSALNLTLAESNLRSTLAL